MERYHLKRWIILGKHKESRAWCSCAGRDGYGVGLWKANRKGWGTVQSRIKIIGGNGGRVIRRMLDESTTFVCIFSLSLFICNREPWANDD